ncbi:rhodanese-like domain-containing protein [Simplicispira psychrophila]|uniref:rhodanese-like domain-containing protein n=1 Tax=Simplicispira psychrophila TaxID=80882 RepID=UPI000484BCBB|nr:rhodanese-like domain-containing protein [Simplicispira psychrophila]
MIVQVRPAQLQAWFEQLAADPGLAPLVLDVREPWELQTASIRAPQGFETLETLAIPMGSIPDQLAMLDKARPIACLCHHGMRSQRVAAFLAHHGFAQVANITGGIDAWSRELDSSVPLY